MADPLDENPYRSPNTTLSGPRTRSARWLVWTGTALLVLAGICVLATVVGMMFSFESVANSPKVKPSDLADNIRVALLPSIAAVPLVVFGAVLLVIGRMSSREHGQ